MKSTHLIHTANPEYSQDSTPWQVPTITMVGNQADILRGLNRILSLHGYTVKPGEIAGRGIPLLIGRRAA